MKPDEKRKLIISVLENGLACIGKYVQEHLPCEFSIIRDDGMVAYSTNRSEEGKPARNAQEQLAYTTETSSGSMTLVMYGLPTSLLESAMNTLKELSFCVQCYFSSSVRTSGSSPMQGGSIKFNLDHRITKDEIVDIADKYCDPNVSYYVSVLNDVTRAEQKYMADNMRKQHSFSISVFDGTDLILIVRHLYNPQTNTIDDSRPSEQEQQYIFRKLLEKFHGCPKFATGKSYRPKDIFLSYQQAKFTMGFMKCTGHCAFSKRYSELSLGIPLMSSNWSMIEQYCLKNIGALLEYDSVNNSGYFNTLHTYLDSNCNGHETAEKLYIHANTLYYRLKKIESLIDYSTTDICDTSHLYLVVKVYSALKESGLLTPDEPYFKK